MLAVCFCPYYFVEWQDIYTGCYLDLCCMQIRNIYGNNNYNCLIIIAQILLGFIQAHFTSDPAVLLQVNVINRDECCSYLEINQYKHTHTHQRFSWL